MEISDATGNATTPKISSTYRAWEMTERHCGMYVQLLDTDSSELDQSKEMLAEI